MKDGNHGRPIGQAHRRRALPALLALVVVACGAAACGPSFQAVYEGDVHFEHCYALEQSASTSESKQGCWREWLREYTYGQSRDRVEYAGARYSELSLHPTLPGEAAVPIATRAPAAPMPTSAFAPPPNVVDGHTDGHAAPEVTATTASALVDAPADAGPRAPGADCTGACEQRWSACRTTCKDGACDACDKAYRACVPPCLQDGPAPHRGASRAVH